MRKNTNRVFWIVSFCLLTVSTLVSNRSLADYTDITLPAANEHESKFIDAGGFEARTTRDTSKHEVRLTSGLTICVEGLVDGIWCSRYWAADGRINFPYWRFAEPAFKLAIQTSPDSEPILLEGDWQWVKSQELDKTERGSRHFMVELLNDKTHVRVQVHTLINGTPVLVRWLEITNLAESPIALTNLSVWSGKLWDEPVLGPLGPFSISTSSPWMSFAWKPLGAGETLIENEFANSYDDPFFMARNESTGEYFICHLAWTANYRIRFDCVTERNQPRSGLSFDIGPRAKDALRVIEPGEAIVTPAVHLGHIAGDVDATVQAMHDHIRRFVIHPRNPQTTGLIQYNIPGDQGYFTGDNFNEQNVKKSIDVAAQIGCELFLLDCPWYDNYGHWVPSPSRFPNGIIPLVKYAHKKGLLFGLQTEIEGGRGNWSQSPVFKEHPDWFADQNIMKLYRSEVAQYMQTELARIFKEYKPDLYRNEFIPNVSSFRTPDETIPAFYVKEWISEDVHGFKENCFWRYYDHWGSVFANLREEFPDLIFQQCANCGTREDLGTVRVFDETNTAEGPVENRIGIIAGKTLCLPPEVIAMGYGTAKERGSLDTFLRASLS